MIGPGGSVETRKTPSRVFYPDSDITGISMGKNLKPPATDFFWDLAGPLLASDAVTEGSLMGFPCLHTGGEFFATCDHRTGELILKLSKERVKELIAEGTGQPFAPAGRVFSQWVLVPERDQTAWAGLMAEAKAFVGGSST